MKMCDTYHDDLNKFFKSHKVDGYLFQPDCTEDVAFLLQEMMKDEDCLISVFCFDLDYGKQYKDGCVKDGNGKPVDLSDTDKLYDYLTGNSKDGGSHR